MSSINDIQGQSPLLVPQPAGAAQPLGSMQQVVPAQSVMESAQAALSDIDSTALQETLEEMGLALGSRIKDLKRRDENAGTRTTQQALIELVESLDDPIPLGEIEPFLQLGEGSQNPLEQLQEAGISPGKQLLLLASLLAHKRPTEQQRRRLERALTTLLAGDEEWSLQLFGCLEMGELPDTALPALKQIYQRSRREDQPQQSMAEWFAEIQEWPDRQRRINVLLRALSFDLSLSADHRQQNRLAATINELKRLLLFLGIEEHCNALARALHLSPEQVLSEIVEIIEQVWIYPEWLAGRLPALALSPSRQVYYLRRLTELLQLLPDPCYKDADQKEQTLKALMMLQDQLDQHS